ncbi:MAG: hypothetical protein AAGE84_16775 [Cyanobacteria bacterium P01_G01_bin.39]
MSDTEPIGSKLLSLRLAPQTQRLRVSAVQEMIACSSAIALLHP